MNEETAPCWNVVSQFFKRSSQLYQLQLNRWTPTPCSNGPGQLSSFLFLLRVFIKQGWYIVTYALGIYHLNLFIVFLTPKILDLDDDQGPDLPTRSNIRVIGGCRFGTINSNSFIRSLYIIGGGTEGFSVIGPSMEERTKMIPFDGTGFHNWKFRMETVLDTFDLLDCLQREVGEVEELRELDGDTAAVKAEKKQKVQERISKGKKCKALIVQAISDNQLELIKDCESPKQIWKTLKNVFERTGVAGQLYIRKQLLQLKYVEGVCSMSDHLLRFDRLIRELKGSGANVVDSDAICHLLLTLPAAFDSVVTAIETLPQGVTMDFVKKRLLDVDMKRRNLEATSHESGSENVAMMSKHWKKKMKCFKCGKIGHKQADCRVRVEHSDDERSPEPSRRSEKKKNGQKANLGVEEQPEVAFVASGADDFVKICWCLDSGASDHMLNDSSFFVSMKRLDPPVEVVVANGQKLLAEYSGDVVVYAVVDGQKKKCVAKNVLYLPGLNCNLFSVKRVAKSGFQVCFVNDGAVIKKSGVTYAVALLKGKLFELDVYCKRNEPGCAMVTGKVSRNAVLWHQRYGHVGCDSLRELVRHNMVDGLNLEGFDESTVLCEPCLSGKITRLPFTLSEDRRSSRPLELVHSDVCGPMTPHTWDGKRFVVTFIDDFSHFLMVYLVSYKDQVFDCFRNYEALVTARFGTRISRFRTDNGGEYVGERMRTFCSEKGISMETTVPYTPQQNGVSERMNRTLMERARAVLVESGFGKEMWGEAVYTATYLTNRCPTSAVEDNKTPFELWTGHKPDVKKLRVFGSCAYKHIPKELRSKLDPKSKKLYMVGYAVNGYRLWDNEKRKVVIARDVVFNEESFFGESGERQMENVKPPKQVELVFRRQESARPLASEEQNFGNEIEPSDNDSEAESAAGPVEPAVRRSGRARREPHWFDCYEMSCGLAMCAEDFEDFPTTGASLTKISDRPPKQPRMKAATENWIFKAKHNDADGINRFKTKWVTTAVSPGVPTTD